MTTTELQNPVEEVRSPWTWWRIIWNISLAAVGYIGPQVIVVFIALVAAATNDPEFSIETWVQKAGSNGFIISISTIASAIVCIPLIRLLTGLAEKHPWEFLGIRRTEMKHVLFACASISIFILISDSLNVLRGRPLVPKFMIDAYVTARWPALLFVAVAIVAPVLEELFFRGLLLSALRARGWSVFRVCIVTSLVFASMHLQYDLYDMTLVFMMGLLLAGARTRSGSLLPGIAMHALANAVGFFEALWTR